MTLPAHASVIAAFHEPDVSAADIAARYGIEEKTVYDIWRRAKRRGELPRVPRAYHRPPNKEQVRRISLAVYDGHPITVGPDKLLKQLCAVHGEPRFDLYEGKER
jgi:hypothetical protein